MRILISDNSSYSMIFYEVVGGIFKQLMNAKIYFRLNWKSTNINKMGTVVSSDSFAGSILAVSTKRAVYSYIDLK